MVSAADADEAGLGRSVSGRLTWDYRMRAPEVRRLYEQATAGSWRAEDLAWATEVDRDRPPPSALGAMLTSSRLVEDPDRRTELAWHLQAWLLSQLLHGEQGALLVSARLVEQMPGVDHKLCAAGQTLDEARHVEVLARYLDDKLELVYEPSRELASVLEDIVGESRWDLMLLAMQVVVEGTALGSFATSRYVLTEPLAHDIVRRIMSDEARHVAFGMTALVEVFAELTTAERAERIDLVKHTIAAMRSRFSLVEVYERFGLDPAEAEEAGRRSFLEAYRRRCFARVPPLLTRLGLWDDEIAALLDVSPALGAAAPGVSDGRSGPEVAPAGE